MTLVSFGFSNASLFVTRAVNYLPGNGIRMDGLVQKLVLCTTRLYLIKIRSQSHTECYFSGCLILVYTQR